jgi:replicative DNA helicase
MTKLPNDLILEEIKTKLFRRQMLAQMATLVNKLREGMDKLDQLKSARAKKTEVTNSKNLEQFESIEFEVSMRINEKFFIPARPSGSHRPSSCCR